MTGDARAEARHPDDGRRVTYLPSQERSVASWASTISQSLTQLLLDTGPWPPEASAHTLPGPVKHRVAGAVGRALGHGTGSLHRWRRLTAPPDPLPDRPVSRHLLPIRENTLHQPDVTLSGGGRARLGTSWSVPIGTARKAHLGEGLTGRARPGTCFVGRLWSRLSRLPAVRS